MSAPHGRAAPRRRRAPAQSARYPHWSKAPGAHRGHGHANAQNSYGVAARTRLRPCHARAHDAPPRGRPRRAAELRPRHATWQTPRHARHGRYHRQSPPAETRDLGAPRHPAASARISRHGCKNHRRQPAEHHRPADRRTPEHPAVHRVPARLPAAPQQMQGLRSQAFDDDRAWPAPPSSFSSPSP